MKPISNDFRISNIQPSPYTFSAQESLGSTISGHIIALVQAVSGHRKKKEHLGTSLV